MSTFQPQEIGDFIYLDHAATTPCSPQARAAALPYESELFFNPSALYGPAVAARRAVEQARGVLAASFGVPLRRAVFTSGGTESNLLAILGTANRRQKPGRLITTATEHPSVLECFAYLRERGHEVVVVPVERSGKVDENAYAAALTPDTLLVSVHHVNNETGAIQPIERLCAMLKAVSLRGFFHSDGVQAFLRLPMPQNLDFYSVSAHKIGGHKGVGGLMVPANAHLPGVRPGGGQEFGLRSGTENVAGIAGFGAAVSVYKGDALATCKAIFWKGVCHLSGVVANGPEPGDGAAHCLKLPKGAACAPPSGDDAARSSKPADGVVHGPKLAEGAPHILNLSVCGLRGETLLHVLESHGVLAGIGAACSAHKQGGSGVLRAMKLPEATIEGAVRISFGPTTTPEQAQSAAEIFCQSVGELRP